MLLKYALLLTIGILHSSCTTDMKNKSIEVTSPAFEEGKMIPSKFTCTGDDISPALNFSNIPSGTKSLALIMDDPDAPRGTFVHWVMWNVPVADALPENFTGGVQGHNGAGKPGYKGPCPPSGTHHYHFKVYALDDTLSLNTDAVKEDLEKAMNPHILAWGELVGLYSKE
jgi:Raf kinase inhibitor-like YbhB/YbcL family protein